MYEQVMKRILTRLEELLKRCDHLHMLVVMKERESECSFRREKYSGVVQASNFQGRQVHHHHRISQATVHFISRLIIKPPPTTTEIMSFLFGGGRPQPSSAEKIAAVEAEIEMVSDMYNRYCSDEPLHESIPRY